VHPLRSDRPLIVYLDIKSPYAYLALAPTLELAERLDIEIDWRPFVLDIPSYLGSAKLDAAGNVVEQERTPEQWAAVKYAYFDCRRYATLRGLTIRGTVKIWDTDLVSVGWLWAKRQGDEVLLRYVHDVYERFWRRDLDAEDPAAVTERLDAAGADVTGFAAWAEGEGAALNAGLQADAFDHGIFGVPTYVVNEEIHFGRDHLPRVEALLTRSHATSRPDKAYDAVGSEPADPPVRTLTIVVDFASLHSHQALPMLLDLVAASALPVRWVPMAGGAPPPAEDFAVDPVAGSRSERHRLWRAREWTRDLERYADGVIAPERLDDTAAADLAALWAEQSGADVTAFVRHLDHARWARGEDLSDPAVVTAALDEAGAPHDGFETFREGDGPERLKARRQAVTELRTPGAPALLLDDEPFVGRQHAPLLRRRLGLA
jgi:2-hydroxychromene-2-carboxylate isomerase